MPNGVSRDMETERPKCCPNCGGAMFRSVAWVKSEPFWACLGNARCLHRMPLTVGGPPPGSFRLPGIDEQAEVMSDG